LTNQFRIKKRLFKYELKRRTNACDIDKIFHDNNELSEMDAILNEKSAIHIILSAREP